MTQPRIILFDVVGTLLHPEPSVAEAYYRAGVAAGSRLALPEVERRFRDAFQQVFGPRRAAAATNETFERDRWRAVIARVFDDVPSIDERLFPDLWNHFGDGANWRLYDDVEATWRQLEALGFELGLASNFDERLHQVCRSFEPLNACPRVFVSSQLGWAKPATEFFREIERRLDCSAHEIALVGDDFENDYRGARDAGWTSIWLTRKTPSHPPESATTAIRSLAELLPRLGVSAPDSST